MVFRTAIIPALVVVLCHSLPSRAATEREVTFDGAGGVRLSGTLVLPDGAAPGARAPALVLVAGSGPTDRNGNQPPLLWTGLLKQTADLLARGGFASLRFDKRGLDRGKRPEGRELADFAAWENFVTDVRAAHRALRNRPEVDGRRVALLGHSEGGLLVMRAALDLQEAGESPPVVVLVSTPGRPLDEVLREQLAASFRRWGTSSERSKSLLKQNDAIIEAIKETGTVPPGVPAMLAPLYPAYIGRFLQSQMKTPPADLAARLKGPVLVLQGEKDLQISSERDAPALAAALECRPGDQRSKLVILPGASHNLKLVKNEGEHAFFGPIVPAFGKNMIEWLREELARE